MQFVITLLRYWANIVLHFALCYLDLIIFNKVPYILNVVVFYSYTVVDRLSIRDKS